MLLNFLAFFSAPRVCLGGRSIYEWSQQWMRESKLSANQWESVESCEEILDEWIISIKSLAFDPKWYKLRIMLEHSAQQSHFSRDPNLSLIRLHVYCKSYNWNTTRA